MLNLIGNYRKSALGICVQMCYIVYMINTTTKGNKMKLTIDTIIKNRTEVTELNNDQIKDLSYGIRFYDTAYSTFTKEEKSFWWKNQDSFIARLDKIEKGEKETTEEETAEKETTTLRSQLWEDCPVCGSQPIYLDTLRCENC